MIVVTDFKLQGPEKIPGGYLVRASCAIRDSDTGEVKEWLSGTNTYTEVERGKTKFDIESYAKSAAIDRLMQAVARVVFGKDA